MPDTVFNIVHKGRTGKAKIAYSKLCAFLKEKGLADLNSNVLYDRYHRECRLRGKVPDPD